jgi:hypothetical protein
MTDERIPEEIVAWMTHHGWGEHHDQWHFERRWDFWHAIAALPQRPAWVDELIREAQEKGWTRSPIQEGEPGNGEDFLFMHRAMIQVLLDNFPQHVHFFRGWNSPPQDASSIEDPVPQDPPGAPPNPSKGAFDPNMAAAITKIEARTPPFATDDEFGLFVETRSRPVPGNPRATSPDAETGIHNYLHNRWSDDDSPINLGDPTVNIFNMRFWKLHGWIDHFWWRFRRAMEFDDTQAGYQEKLAFYVGMMSHEVHHPHFETVMRATAPRRTRNVFIFDAPSN